MPGGLSWQEHGADATKPWMVLLHPTPLDHHFWLPAAAAFTGEYRLLLPDLPGHGGSPLLPEPMTLQSMAAAVLRLLDARGIEAAVFCGCSIGGYLLYELWRQAPQRMRALVIASAKPHADSEEGRRARLQTIATIAAQGTAPFFDAMLQGLVGEPARREDPQIDQRLRQMMERMPAASAMAVQRALMERPDSRLTAATIRVPVAVLAGVLDRVSTPAELRELADLVPGSAYFLLPGMGHYAPYEQPRLVGALIRRFLDDHL
jgi:pimeloyl-ACP methyl ester carboxylesterase